MQKTLDKLTIKMCENLPLDITFYEKDGICQRPNEVCDYCKQYNSEIYFCKKKTYTLNREFNFV